MLVELLLFWLSASALLYVFVGYPILINLRAKCGSVFHRRARIVPTVSILVVAYNEASRIRRRIANLLELAYDKSRLEIVIASDGSSDDTVERAAAYRQAGVKIIAFDHNRGKPAVLNDLVPRLQGEIVVLMDVRQHIAEDAIHQLVDNFADPKVGAVSGELVLTSGGGSEGLEGVGFYWRYEKFIRHNESRIDSTVGATGALYAIRRELFEPIPEETILDDVLIPMQIVRKGYRVIFEPGARASESLSESMDAECRRKVRTIAGNFQLLCRHRWLLNPFANRLWLQTLSHKFGRLLCPVLLVLVLIANLLLLHDYFYREIMALQLLFYAAAITGMIFPKLARNTLLFSVPHAFCVLNWSTAVGCYRYLRGRQQVTWAQATTSKRDNHYRAEEAAND